MKQLLILSSVLLCGVGSAQEGHTHQATNVLPSGAYTQGQFSHSDPYRANGMHCATPPSAQRPVNPPSFAPSDCSSSQTSLKSSNEPGNGIVYQIPVVFHVISNTSNVGNLAQSRLTSQIDIMNEDWNALAGTPGGLGNNARFHFYLANVDPNGNPTNGIDRVTNNTWFADSGSYWNSLNWDSNRYLNIYTNQASGALGYVPGLPADGIVGASFDRVVVLYSTVGRNASGGPPYNQGRTVTHEVGHYLGLEHTFAGGCAPGANPACFSSGDLICDTFPEAAPVFGCPANPTSCGNADPFRNYMDYTNDTCMREFTNQQINRMRCTMAEWRTNLHTPECVTPATAVARNGGSNPSAFSSSTPILGETMTMSVVNNDYNFATIVVYAGGGSMMLGGGQVVLVNLGSPFFGQFGPLSLAGGAVEQQVDLPLDMSLCNISFTAQTILFGGTSPFALSNAMDMTSGGF